MFVAGLDHADARALLDAAVRAPSLHNTQPWRFEVGAGAVSVYRDVDRWLPAEDPSGNGLYLSIGAAVLNLRVAAAELGRLAHVTLLPEPRDPDHVARLTLAAGLGVDPELQALFAYLPRRRTNRRPYDEGRAVPERALQDLRHAARLDGARLHLVGDSARVRRLLELAAEEAVAEMSDLRRLEERARWVGGARDGDGVPAGALGPLPSVGPPVTRDLAVRQPDRERAPARFERRPLLAVLSSERDDPLGWLGAGQALQRVLLTAARWGLSASFLNQALGRPELRRLALGPGTTGLHPQMLLRLGYARLPEPTPRRPLEDFLRRPARASTREA